MIVYDLACDNGHVFEAWFKDSAAYDRQEKKRQLACAVCGSSQVKKAPMAPRIGKTTSAEAAGEDAGEKSHQASYANDPRLERAKALMDQLAALRRHVEQNADYVGDKFAEEARKMHYGEAEKRNVYGEATNAEARELTEEGVDFTRIPWMPRYDS